MTMRVRWGRVFGAVGSVGALAAGTTWLLSGGVPIENQAWLERLPRSPQDEVVSMIFVAPKDSAQRIGAVSRSSRWKHRTDLFRYGIVKDKARLVFPQDGSAIVVELKAYECAGEAPEPFTLCLDVTTGKGRDRRTATLYSTEEMRFPSAHAPTELPLDPDATRHGPTLMDVLGRE